MQAYLIKKARTIDLDSYFKEYIIKNYDASSITDKIKKFIGDMNQNRSVISKIKNDDIEIDKIKQCVNILNHYTNELIALKSKMAFGEESFACKIKFEWKDTIKESFYESYNINFEYYNSLFNLAAEYYRLGYYTSIQEGADKNVLKEAFRCFQYALYIYSLIKEECLHKIKANEMPIDLLGNHLDSSISMCIAYGNIQILGIFLKFVNNVIN